MSLFTLSHTLALAFITAQLAHYFAQGYITVIAELLCWLFIATFRRVTLRSSAAGWQHDLVIEECSSLLLWTTAMTITGTAVFSAVGDVGWMMPIITPTLIVLRDTSLLPRLPAAFRTPLHFPTTQVFAALLFVPLLFATSTSGSTILAFGAFAVFGLVGLYVMLIKLVGTETDLAANTKPQNEYDALGLDLRAVVALALPAVLFVWIYPLGLEQFNALMAKALLAACFKAAHWILIFRIVRTHDVPWEIAPTILTYASATNGALSIDAFPSTGLARAFTQAAVALFALYQSHNLLPKLLSGRYILLIFVTIPIIALFRQEGLGSTISELPSAIDWAGGQPKHPIERFIYRAQADFASLQKRQSKTLEEAIEGYRLRYSREPPPGFDKWFEYARSQESVLIDDFDLIDHDLKPFWRISPQKLQESIKHMTQTFPANIQWREIKNGTYSAEGTGWASHKEDMGDLLKDVIHDLKDIQFVVNILDEPRVIMNPERIDEGGTGQPTFDSDRLSLRQLAVSCRSSWLNPDIPTPDTLVEDYGIPFIQPGTSYNAENPCQHPNLKDEHGAFISPHTTSITHDPVPLLSQAAPLGYNDIIYPTFWYLDRYKEQAYNESNDRMWEDKLNTLYWAGSTTGALSTSGAWRLAHRQRFMDAIDGWNRTEHKYLESTWKPSSPWKAYESAIEPSALNFTLETKFTSVFQCTGSDCGDQKSHFHVAERESQEHMYKHRFLFDIDGNSFSGRYYTLLSSNSTVFKQTAFREWHDQRLIPWVHYVPVTMGMEELPELLRYFSTEDGNKKAKEIAAAGRAWQPKALRKTDFRIYMFRLLLELARLMDPKREVEVGTRVAPKA